MKIEVIYSPICEASMAFLGALQEWLEIYDTKIDVQEFNPASSHQQKLYEANGLAAGGRMLENCFVDVFFCGRLIDTVPLSKKKIYSALGIAAEGCGEENPIKAYNGFSAVQLKEAILKEEISWIPTTENTFLEEMTMCLQNYPFGNPPERFHPRCAQLKKQVFEQVFKEQTCAGIYAKHKNKVIGLIEVFPREIMKRHGFLTGNTGHDGDYLTVGCYEVGAGMPRKEMIDELMLRLETIYGMFTRKKLEGIGVYEWPEGFTPYWVYDKYGFKKKEIITGKKIVMEKSIH